MIAAAVFLLGIGLVTVGAALVYPPAAFVVAGVMLMGGAWLHTRGVRSEA